MRSRPSRSGTGRTSGNSSRSRPLSACESRTSPARGSVCDKLVEGIDIAPTFLDVLGGDWRTETHRLEGRSLLPFLRGEVPAEWRRYAVSEYDYSLLPAAARLGLAPRDARLIMIADKRWKYVHAVGFRPMLYDLETDPNEFRDLGSDPACAGERGSPMHSLLPRGVMPTPSS